MGVKNNGCYDKKPSTASIRNFARVLYFSYIQDGIYSVVDKLAFASSPQSLLNALYEALRGIREESDRQAARKVVEKLGELAQDPECLEEALVLAKRIAVEAISYKPEGSASETHGAPQKGQEVSVEE